MVFAQYSCVQKLQREEMFPATAPENTGVSTEEREKW